MSDANGRGTFPAGGNKSHNAVGIRRIDGAQQNRIHNRKDGSVCSNTQCQRRNRHETESGRLPEHAERLLEILQK
jgi:hypothetical protein